MKEYIAKRVSYKLNLEDKLWESIPALELNEGWWDQFPKNFDTKARLVHFSDGLIVRMETNEWPITVKAMSLNDEVCLDSCMEFFFTPNTEDKNYMNIEANAASVPLCAIGEERNGRKSINPIGGGVEVKTQIEFERGWKLYIFIPFSFIEKHFSGIGKEMRANFYKCGEESAVDHYSVWNKIETEEPDYHRPECFGRIILSED